MPQIYCVHFSFIGDLDRIKSTSFFQRVPPPSEVRQKEEEESALEAAAAQKPEESQTAFAPESAIVPVSESESEGEDEDDIFDTTYIDVIASGEVKLVHIPGNCFNVLKYKFQTIERKENINH